MGNYSSIDDAVVRILMVVGGRLRVVSIEPRKVVAYRLLGKEVN